MIKTNNLLNMEQIPNLTSNLDEEKSLKTIKLETESKSKEKYIIK